MRKVKAIKNVKWQRISFALLLILCIFPTQSLSEESPTVLLDQMGRTLTKTQEENLAKYIRTCESEKAVMKVVETQLTACEFKEGRGFSGSTLVGTALGTFVIGLFIGATQ